MHTGHTHALGDAAQRLATRVHDLTPGQGQVDGIARLDHQRRRR